MATKLESLSKTRAALETDIAVQTEKINKLMAEQKELPRPTEAGATAVGAAQFKIGILRDKLTDTLKAIEVEEARLKSPEALAAGKHAKIVADEMKKTAGKNCRNPIDRAQRRGGRPQNVGGVYYVLSYSDRL
jgi:hypothetical protein